MGAQAVRIDSSGTVDEVDLGTAPGPRFCEYIGCEAVTVVRLAPSLDMWIGRGA